MKSKKWIAFILAVVMLISLSACSSSGSNKKRNKNGDLVTVCLVTKAEGSDYYTTFQYDNQGNILQCAEYNGGTECVRDEYEYDTNGQLIKLVSYWFNEIHCQETYTYDENGNLIQSCKSYADGPEYISEYEYNHDEDGNLIQTCTTHYENNVEISEYTYNKNGNLIKEDAENGVLECTYNKDGYLIKTVGYNNIECAYDENGRLSIMVNCLDLETKMETEIIYENGIPTKIISSYGEEEISLTCTTVQMTKQQAQKKQNESIIGTADSMAIIMK